MQASVCMRAALILYSSLVLVEVGLNTAMADPEAALRAKLATQHLGGNISSVALQGEIDAGRHAVKGIITLQPPGAVPTAEGLRAEVWTAMMPVTQRIIQVHGTVTQAQLLAIVPNIYTCVVFRTRLRSRYRDFMEGAGAAVAHQGIVNRAVQIWPAHVLAHAGGAAAGAPQGAPPVGGAAAPGAPDMGQPAPPAPQPADPLEEEPEPTWNELVAEWRRAPGSVMVAWLLTLWFVVAKWWASAVPMIALAIYLLSEFVFFQAIHWVGAAGAGLLTMTGTLWHVGNLGLVPGSDGGANHHDRHLGHPLETANTCGSRTKSRPSDAAGQPSATSGCTAAGPWSTSADAPAGPCAAWTTTRPMGRTRPS